MQPFILLTAALMAMAPPEPSSLAPGASPPPAPPPIPTGMAGFSTPQDASTDPHHVVFHASPDEGVSMGSADGNFSVRFGAFTQFAVDETLQKPHGPAGGVSFNVRILRPNIRGNLFTKWIRFFIQPELANTPRLLDAQLDIQPWDEVGIRVGQFITPFTRSFMTPVPLLQFQDFSLANAQFRADRDTGAMLFGTPLSGAFEYYAGVFNGNGLDKAGDDDRRPMWMGRVAYNPFGPVPYSETAYLAPSRKPKLAIAANAFENHNALGQRVITGGADIALHWQGFVFETEVYRRHIGKPARAGIDAWGATFQAGYLFLGHFEVGERISIIYPDLGSADFQVLTFESQVTYYVLGNHLKANLRHIHTEAGARARVATPGVSQSLQLALQAAF